MLTEIDSRIRAAIAPTDLPQDHEIMDTFGECMREVSALFIIRLSAHKGGWQPFTQAELDAMDSRGSFRWNGLDRPEWIHRNDDGTFEVRGAFIARCLGLHREPRRDGAYLARRLPHAD